MISRAVLAVLLLLVAGSALAQTGEERARVLFREANQLYARKLYLDALAKYREAKALYPSHKIDLNIGGTLDALGRRTEAAVFFERFLLQSASAPEAIIAAARSRLVELRTKLARVKVTSLQDGASVHADGVVVGTTPLDIPVYLEPGQHRLEARKAGTRPSSRTLTVTAGQELAVDLSPEPTAASAPASRTTALSPATRATASAPVLAPAPEPVPARPDPLVAQRRTRTIVAWTSLAAGGACALTAAFLYGLGVSQGNDAHDRYMSYGASEAAKMESAWSEVESAQSKVIAGHVLAGVAAVGIGVSIYQFLRRAVAEERPAQLMITPLAAGAALRGSF